MKRTGGRISRRSFLGRGAAALSFGKSIVCSSLSSGAEASKPRRPLAADRKRSHSPLRNTFIISGHRAGGRVHAPDNSMPNVLYAIANELTAIEVDLRLTRDGELVLWHDASLPNEYLNLPSPGSTAIRTLSSRQMRSIRYSATVGNRKWENQEIVFLDDLVPVTKGRINLHLDTKDVGVEEILKAIRKHRIQKECLVMRGEIDYLARIHAAEPDVCLEYADNTLGRRQVHGKWQWYPDEKQHKIYRALMGRLKASNIDAFCTKGLTKEKVAICHGFGILVRTSAGNMKPGRKPDPYLELGVDYALTDDPLLIKNALRRLRPGSELSSPGQTFFELIRNGQ